MINGEPDPRRKRAAFAGHARRLDRPDPVRPEPRGPRVEGAAGWKWPRLDSARFGTL